ncbi:helix-turn-helix transcriptional regulator [Defluviitalea phaphyphila]|uniref:helix-turn-helix transcriptional regulator n=1 Tax=Defluviitalea phaphyphila TaxID=1473580 RepID=UPI0007300F55|nr:AraC family transcriptional regulator [Defluviitalea phaphyphila]
MIVSDRICNFHIKRAIKYMENNYDKDLRLHSMAKFLGLNKHYLSYLFKKETGITYSDFVNYIRIEKSKELIKNTNLSILEIALSVGYNNQNYYTIAFKKIHGISPLKYRHTVTS